MRSKKYAVRNREQKNWPLLTCHWPLLTYHWPPKENMKTFPTLTTPRLLLQAFTLEDAPEVQGLAGDPKVASTTPGIPHP